MIRHLAAAALAVTLAVGVCAQTPPNGPPPETVRLLLPSTSRNLPGMFGTNWTNEAFILFRTNEFDFVEPFDLDPTCDPPEPCDQLISYGSGEQLMLQYFRTHPGQTPGQYLYVGAENIDDVSVHLFLRETTRGNQALELPVVKPHDFSLGARTFLNVPLTSSARSLLLVYGSDPDVLGSVRVRIYSALDSTLLRDNVYPLDVVQVTENLYGTAWKVRPPVAQVYGVTDGLTAANVFIEVTPLTPGIKVWSLLVFTDNTSNQVTLHYAN